MGILSVSIIFYCVFYLSRAASCVGSFITALQKCWFPGRPKLGFQGLRQFEPRWLVLQLGKGISGCTLACLSSGRSPVCDWLGYFNNDTFLLVIALLWLLAVRVVALVNLVYTTSDLKWLQRLF